MENGNNQAASETNPPAAAEPTSAELQAKIAELEKQNEGRLRDLQKEREKRHELESRFNTAPAPSAQNDVTQDELGKVLNPYIAPLAERVVKAEAFVANTFKDKAIAHLAKVTGKSAEAVVTDSDLDSKLTNIVRRFGLQGNVYDVTVRACEIMELENLKAKEAERQREISTNADASLPVGNAVRPVAGAKEMTEDDFTNLPMHEYEKLSSAGSFTRTKEGKIVFIPSPK